jgi:YHS domain-containing protein
MYRAIFELLFTLLIIVIARSLLTSLAKGVSTASKTFQNSSAQPRNQDSSGSVEPPPKTSANELHKDPVCGTYVAASTPYQRTSTGQVFYYCSTECRGKHTPVAR